ncbi:MAG: hypothetical protein LBF08_07575 [Dysgonamonadaceae bacterium]|jgi:hypothetical protein|nr:hypothetical protein [Dysgonamonadaceae bacterium]
MYDLKKLRPILVKDLIRVGRKSDGGYVLSASQIEKTEILLSFGICDDWSFEADFCKKAQKQRNNSNSLKAIQLHAFDYSSEPLNFLQSSLKHFALTQLNILTCNIPRTKKYAWRAIHFLWVFITFKRFFKSKLHRFYYPKFLGQKDDKIYTRLDTVFKNLQEEPENLSVFIKMDIESWEYRTLPQLVPFFDKINGLTVEFHELDIAEKKFEEIMELFSTHFDIAHVHGNCYGGLIHGTKLPMVLEITFINKALGVDSTVLSPHQYPIKGLDFPNNKKEDIPLIFN